MSKSETFICECDDPSQCWEPCGELGKSIEHAKVAEPVKVPSDLPHALRDLVAIWRKQQGEYPAEGKQAAAAVRLCANELELLLSRYGQSAPKKTQSRTAMNKEPSLFEEDYPPTGGAGFIHVEPVTADEVFDVLAGRINQDRNGRDAGYWLNQIVENSNLAELPLMVVAEIVRNASAHNDGSHVQMRGYLESILNEEGLI